MDDIRRRIEAGFLRGRRISAFFYDGDAGWYVGPGDVVDMMALTVKWRGGIKNGCKT